MNRYIHYKGKAPKFMSKSVRRKLPSFVPECQRLKKKKAVSRFRGNFLSIKLYACIILMNDLLSVSLKSIKNTALPKIRFANPKHMCYN